MPQSTTELARLLEGDSMLCVRRRPKPRADVPRLPLPPVAAGPPLEAPLARIVAAWPRLPSTVQAAILALIEPS